MSIMMMYSKWALLLNLYCSWTWVSGVGATRLPQNFEDLLNQRIGIIQEEDSMSFGGKIKLSPEEQRANAILMKYKIEELQKGVRNPDSFLPAQDFLRARDKIECSPVYRLIRNMPKGSLLHAHHSAMGTRDFILKNITYRDHLYVCEENEITGTLQLRFLNESQASGKIEIDPIVGGDDYDYDFGYVKDNKDGGHCQGFGGWRPVQVARERDPQLDFRIAAALRLTPAPNDHPSHKHGGSGGDSDQAWTKFLDIFRFLKPLLSYRPVYEDYLQHVLQELYDDNIQFAEIRTPFPTLYELDGRKHRQSEFVEISNRIINRFVENHPDFVGIKWIFSKQRNVNDSILDDFKAEFQQLRHQYPNLIAGFDLVGQEDKGRPLLDFARKLYEFDRETKFFFHAGETDWNYQEADQNLIEAVLINNTRRIGHGYAILKHPRLMELVKERNIALEVSPISNQVLGLVQDLRNHPASNFFAQDLPIVVSNDDPGFWGALGLSHDFYEAFIGIMSSKADLRALKQLALNAIHHSSLADHEKQKLTQIWEKRWHTFVNQVTNGGPIPRSTRLNHICDA